MSDKTNSNDSEEKQFKILPHPAKHNDPPQTGAGLNSKPELEAFRAQPGPVLTGPHGLVNAGPPATSEELAARTAELNQ